MTNYHYVNSSPARSSIPLKELAKRIAEAGNDLVALSACVQELSSLPHSGAAEKLAGEVRSTLQREMNLALPASYPMTSEETSRWRQLVSAWRALAPAHIRWMGVGSRNGTAAAMDALSCLRQIVLLCGVTHWPVPEGLWLDVHGIYNAGLESDSAGKRLRRPYLRHHSRTTIEWEYLQTILLGVTDPWSQLPQELMAMESMAEKWVSMVKIGTDLRPGWYIDRYADRPAKWCPSGEGVSLDFTELLEFLDGHRELASPVGRFEWVDQPDDTLSIALLDHWRGIWTEASLCVDDHLEIDQAELEVGLNAIFDRCQTRLSSGAVIFTAESNWCKVEGHSLQVGDLLAVFDPAGNQIERLAVVCRIRCDGGDIPDLRLQMRTLEGQAIPVGVQPLYRGARPCDYQRGLLIDAQGTSRLILAWQPFRKGIIVRLLSGNEIYPVRLLSRENFARGVLSCVCESAGSQFQK